MKRREFSQLATLMAAASSMHALAQTAGSASAARPSPGGSKRGAGASIGTNLSGMEWGRPGLRHGLSSQPNIHFTVPRKADIAYLAANGFRKNRLPIQWELLQPMLHDTQANQGARIAIGEPGQFHATYESYITGVLDAHAAVGATCIVDLHNSCRYRDFRYQPDGAVIGLAVPPGALLRPYTRSRDQIWTRIFSLEPGATLTQAHFVDFWTRAARKWMKHPGFGGYGLMNEPHDMPKPGSLVGSDEEGADAREDLAIWPAYALAAIRAIRASDPKGLIYVSGNQWSAAMAMGTKNPGFPLEGGNLIYEVHMYLDAFNNGATFDYDTEVGKKMSAGFGRGSIHRMTGVDRLRLATDWARKEKVKLALTEVGMPIDDIRWRDMFLPAAQHAHEADCEIYTWMGGNHWPIRNYPINQVPGWHQNKTLEPLVAGVLKEVVGIDQASLFDDGPGYSTAGVPVTITVYARGNLAKQRVLSVSSSGKGKLSKTRLVIDAGANGSDTYTYTPADNEAAVLTYSSETASQQLPPPRQVFSIADPVRHASKSLAEAALTVLAKHQACKWNMADAYTDYVLGAPAASGDPIRAVSDSGFGSSPGNAMEMLNFLNDDSASMGTIRMPAMRVRQGKKSADFDRLDTTGLWCKKRTPVPVTQPDPVNRVPYNLDDAYFVVALVSVTGNNTGGVVFEASRAEDAQFCELGFQGNRPRAVWTDPKGQAHTLSSPKELTPDTPTVLSLACSRGSQILRVDGTEAANGRATLPAAPFSQMLIGWGFPSYFPRKGFRGSVYAVVTGKGRPTPGEMGVLERYLAGLASA
ncbi:MAG: Twin-arginine translocation pathway signal [Polaromonas sp.]|nr:Twin-arginine translocation pathway signal [Polaromonas sp.]